MMILAFDTHYFNNSAKTVGLSFQDWDVENALQIKTEILKDIAPYEPGFFYRRELPCILSLLSKFHLENVNCIVVDGYCILDNSGKHGLGGHLYEALERQIPIIGVAKTRFRANTLNVLELLRGKSEKPLFISSIGMELQEAYQNIQMMHGAYRIPTLLQALDQETKNH
ncbi:MAG: endonuclease V [Saprospiraceae bacterium]